MSGDQNGLASLQLRLDVGLEVRLNALDHVGQALGFRNRIAGVARIVVLRVLVVRIDLRRRCGVGTTPQHELLVTVLLTDLGLVLALQGAVVTLDTLLGQRDVDPAGELIGFIPCALSVTEQY